MNRGVIFIFLCAFSFVSAGASPRAGFTDKILAVVNGEAITRSDIDEILAPIYSQYKNTYSGETLTEKLNLAKEDILNQLINDKLILQEAKKQGITVDEKDVDRIIDSLKDNFSGDEEFNAVLRRQNVTLTGLKKRYREQLMIKKLIETEILSRIIVTPTEMAAYYHAHKQQFTLPEQVRLRNIFLRADANNAENAARKAGDIYEQLKKGVPFMEMVERHSEDPNITEAGNMGFIKRGTMRAEIENAVFSLNPGQISPPVQTPAGFYIFKVEEKIPAIVPALEEIQGEIRQEIFQMKSKKRLEEWMEKLKQSSFIEIKNHEEKS